jgi:hypothetical protein
MIYRGDAESAEKANHFSYFSVPSVAKKSGEVLGVVEFVGGEEFEGDGACGGFARLIDHL